MARTTRQVARRSTPHRYSGMKYRGKPTRGEQSQQTGSAILAIGAALGIVVLFVLGFALVATIGRGSSVASASGGGPVSKVPAGYGSLNHAKGACGNAGQAACPAADPGWFAVSTASPAAVAAAISGSADYVAMQGSYGYVALDTPALVHAYNAHTGNAYYDDDHWVVSVRIATGARCGIFDFVYDQAHGRMRFSSYGVITPQDTHAGQAFPYIPSATAMAQLHHQRGLGVLAGTQPQLIFFPIDPSFPYLNSPVHNWRGGGNSAMEPMWHMVGSDGHDYFVGTDLNVHVQAELPIATGQP